MCRPRQSGGSALCAAPSFILRSGLHTWFFCRSYPLLLRVTGIGMICIKPIAPTGDVASAAAPPLSASMTARTHASGRPNRRAASAMYAAHLSIVGEQFLRATLASRPNDALQLSSAPSGTNNSALKPSAQAVKIVIRSITDLSGSASEGSAQLRDGCRHARCSQGQTTPKRGGPAAGLDIRRRDGIALATGTEETAASDPTEA